MAFIQLGSRRAVGVVDTTGNNVGNWTVTFDPFMQSIKLPYYEVYRMVTNGAPGSTFDIFIDQFQWDTHIEGEVNSWEADTPMYLRVGETLYFYWSNPSTDSQPPKVTIWIRYDADNVANQNAGGIPNG